MRPSSPWILACAATLSLAASGCLKSRTQVRPDAGAQEAAPARHSALEIEEIKNELTRVSGRVEEMDHAQRTRSSPDVTGSLTRLESRVGELEKNQLLILSELKELKDRPGLTPVAAGAHRAGGAGGGAKNLLQEGHARLGDGDYAGAGEKFRAALSLELKGKDAAEAHYGAGEAEYGLRNWKKAIVELSKVREAYPKSARVPASLLKIAACFEKLGMQKEARGFYFDLTEKYPSSSEAKKARAKLKQQPK